MNKPPVRAALAALIAYQVLMYGFVVRSYLHMSVVLLPYLMGAADYRLYDTINIGYPPGWLWFNAVFYRLIPDHELRLRIGTVIITVCISLLVYSLARRWWGEWAGLVASALFATWGALMLEYLMYFELALGLLGSAALAVWHKHDSRWWQPFLAGILVGLAVIVKQHALALAGVYCLWRMAGLDWKATLKDVLRFACGMALPGAGVLLVLAAHGLLDYGLYLMLGSHGAYFETASQSLEPRELALLALWLALVPPFALQAVLRRESWRSQDTLLLGLLIALLVPAYPRYARFHLAGAVPMVALISTGAGFYLFRRGAHSMFRIYGALAAAAMMLVGVGLPVYYRLQLGDIESQYAALHPLSEWVQAQTGAPPDTRMWILPDIDPTANFYAVGGYLPPLQYAQTYPWIVVVPPLFERVMAGIEAAPPLYVIRVDDWRFQIPTAIEEYVEAHYTLIAQTVIPTDVHNVTLYRRNSS
jgi:hypothetical protein